MICRFSTRCLPSRLLSSTLADWAKFLYGRNVCIGVVFPYFGPYKEYGISVDSLALDHEACVDESLGQWLVAGGRQTALAIGRNNLLAPSSLGGSRYYFLINRYDVKRQQLVDQLELPRPLCLGSSKFLYSGH